MVREEGVEGCVEWGREAAGKKRDVSSRKIWTVRTDVDDSCVDGSCEGVLSQAEVCCVGR